MKTIEKIKIMQAWVDGVPVEFYDKGRWKTLPSGQDPIWLWNMYDYRIKPEPMEIEVWVNGTKVSTNETHNMGPEWTKKKFREVL